jgi:hypothetical protein
VSGGSKNEATPASPYLSTTLLIAFMQPIQLQVELEINHKFNFQLLGMTLAKEEATGYGKYEN